MPANKNPTTKKKPTKTSKRRKAIWIVGSIAAFLVLWTFVLAPPIERWMARQAAVLLPDVYKIYELETRNFPDYTVSVYKNTLYTDGQQYTSYQVTLQSLHLPKQSEYVKAGKLACSTGLPEGTHVTVIGRQQILMFYIAKSLTRECRGNYSISEIESI